jgi:hypothetical protein
MTRTEDERCKHTIFIVSLDLIAGKLAGYSEEFDRIELVPPREILRLCCLQDNEILPVKIAATV